MLYLIGAGLTLSAAILAGGLLVGRSIALTARELRFGPEESRTEGDVD